ISVPFTTAQTSAAWCSGTLQPPTTPRIRPARGNNAPAWRIPRIFRSRLGWLGRKLKIFWSGCFFHAAQPNAAGADTHLLANSVYHRAHPLQIRVPPATPCVIRVAYHVSIVRPFAADFTLQCHICFARSLSHALNLRFSYLLNWRNSFNRASCRRFPGPLLYWNGPNWIN